MSHHTDAIVDLGLTEDVSRNTQYQNIHFGAAQYYVLMKSGPRTERKEEKGPRIRRRPRQNADLDTYVNTLAT